MVTAPSEPRADRRVAGRASPFRRYWQAFRVNSSARLTEVGDALEYEWPVFLAWTAGGAVTLVGAIRLLQAWSLESSSAVRNWLGVVPGALLAAGCLGLLLRIYWQIHRDTVVAGSHSGGDARRRRPYVLALLVALVAVVVSVEVFAGLTTLLWKHGRVDAGASEPALWTAERHYLWQLANSVPLLDATRTVGWTNPDVFTDRWSGGLLLLFKLLLVFPSVQIAFAGYRLHQARWVALGAPNKSHRMRPTIATTSDDWFLGAFILVCVGALSAVLVLVIAPTSIADEWAQNHLAGGVGALGVHASLHTLQVIADCLVAGVVVSLFWGLMDGLTCDLLDELANDPGLRFHSLAGIVVSMCAWLLVLPLLVLVGAAVTLALLHAGVAHAHPAMSAPEELEAAATWYAWHFADAIPFFDLPGTLHWSLRHTFADHWSGALLLASKLVFFAVLVVPIARLARLALYRTARSSRASGSLQSWRDLSDELAAIHAVLAEGRADRFAFARALHMIPAAEAALERTRRLFGTGDVSDAAEGAFWAAVAEVHATATDPWVPSRRVRRRLESAGVTETLTAAHGVPLANEAARLLTQYETLAATRLRESAARA